MTRWAYRPHYYRQKMSSLFLMLSIRFLLVCNLNFCLSACSPQRETLALKDEMRNGPAFLAPTVFVGREALSAVQVKRALMVML